MTYTMTVHPEDEIEFLTKLMEDGLYFPAEVGFKLQEHVILKYTSQTGKLQMLYCIVVGRCFEGKDRIPSTVKIQALQGQHSIIRCLLDVL